MKTIKPRRKWPHRIWRDRKLPRGKWRGGTRRGRYGKDKILKNCPVALWNTFFYLWEILSKWQRK